MDANHACISQYETKTKPLRDQPVDYQSKEKIVTNHDNSYSSVTAYNWRSLSPLAYIPSPATWGCSWILTDRNCAAWPLPVVGAQLRCNDRNWLPGWKLLTDSCHAPLWSDLKLAGFKAGSGMVPEIVGGTLGMGGLFLAFSSGVWGNGRRPKDEYLPSVAVRWTSCPWAGGCCWSFDCCCDWSNLKLLKFGKSLQACLSQ